MRIELDKEIDVAYAYFKEIAEGEVDKTISLNDSINVDLDCNGRILGIEVIDASKNLPVSVLGSNVVA